MNPAQVHLALNHFPIIGLLFTLIFLAYGIVKRNDVIVKFSLYLTIFIALVTLPVFFSGEPAEEIIEETTSVSHDIIHEHEEAGEFAFIFMEVFGVLAIVSLVLMSKEKFTDRLRYAFLLIGIATFILMARVGSLGGKIMHPELNMEMPAPEHDDD